MNMTGYTINELSEKLRISEHSVYQRLLRRKIEPLTKQAIYPESALKAIETASKGGRGIKVKAADPPAPEKKPRKK